MTMPRHPVRLGRIPWINTFPVYGAIDRGRVKVDAEMVTGTATETVMRARPARSIASATPT